MWIFLSDNVYFHWSQFNRNKCVKRTSPLNLLANQFITLVKSRPSQNNMMKYVKIKAIRLPEVKIKKEHSIPRKTLKLRSIRVGEKGSWLKFELEFQCFGLTFVWIESHVSNTCCQASACPSVGLAYSWVATNILCGLFVALRSRHKGLVLAHGDRIVLSSYQKLNQRPSCMPRTCCSLELWSVLVFRCSPLLIDTM